MCQMKYERHSVKIAAYLCVIFSLLSKKSEYAAHVAKRLLPVCLSVWSNPIQPYPILPYQPVILVVAVTVFVRQQKKKEILEIA